MIEGVEISGLIIALLSIGIIVSFILLWLVADAKEKDNDE